MYEAGVIENIGRVDNGNTMTDKMDLEKKRGISIQSTPISFNYKDLKINLIDTPGHVEFVAEVERAMSILDGAILVVSAKEGVQSHTALLFDSLKKLGKPIIIFVNKLDRIGVDKTLVIENIKKELSSNIIELHDVEIKDKNIEIGKLYQIESMMEELACHDDELFERYICGEKISVENQVEILKRMVEDKEIYPVCYGSALNHLGIKELLQAISSLLPSKELNPSGEPTGVVFKITRDHHNRRQIYLRLYSGVLVSRGMIKDEKISFIFQMKNGTLEYSKTAVGNDIVVITGPEKLSVGDTIGEPFDYERISLGTPTFRTKISSNNKRELAGIIDVLAEADPFLEYEIDPHSKDLYLNLFGEIQMEIIDEMIRHKYGVIVQFSDPMTIFKEMPVGIGESAMYMYKDSPFAATVGIRIEPHDITLIESEVPTGHLPKTFQNGIRDGIEKSLREGLKGWEVINAKVVITIGEFDSVSSTPSDYRDLTPLVLMEALDQSKTKLLWPVNKFYIKVDKKIVGKILADLMKMKATEIVSIEENDKFILSGKLPVETSYYYEKRFVSITSGMGIFSTFFHSYEEAPEDIYRERKRNEINPLNKGKYLLNKLRTC